MLGRRPQCALCFVGQLSTASRSAVQTCWPLEPAGWKRGQEFDTSNASQVRPEAKRHSHFLFTITARQPEYTLNILHSTMLLFMYTARCIVLLYHNEFFFKHITIDFFFLDKMYCQEMFCLSSDEKIIRQLMSYWMLFNQSVFLPDLRAVLVHPLAHSCNCPRSVGGVRGQGRWEGGGGISKAPFMEAPLWNSGIVLQAWQAAIAY